MASKKHGKQKAVGTGVPDRDERVDSIPDLAAQELPDGGRGPIETSPGHEIGRRIPKDTGGTSYTGDDVGLRGLKDDWEQDIHGGRKKN
jgi:hypothetical protein